MSQQMEDGNIHTLDRVQILDNGVSIGTVEVIDGKWSLPITALSVGEHNVIAQYGELESAPRKFKVQQIVHYEDFESAATGAFARLERPYFTVSYQTYGPVGTAVPASILSAGSGSGFSRNYLLFTSSNRPIDSAKYTLTASMDFASTYSVVSMWGRRRATFGTSSDRCLIEAIDESSRVVDSFDLRNIGENVNVQITLRASGQSRIKSLKFSMAPQTVSEGATGIALDSMTMTI